MKKIFLTPRTTSCKSVHHTRIAILKRCFEKIIQNEQIILQVKYLLENILTRGEIITLDM
jgi:hypothetical protein